MSLINLEHKILYIHIPKTAGTSMEQAPFLKTVGHKHANIEYFAKYLLSIQGLELSELWKFCFVRNPYERFVSAMFGHTIREAIPADILNQIANANLPSKSLKERFTEFVLQHKDRLNDFVPLRPMADFVCIGQELVMDFIGRYENLEADWQQVCDRVGVNFRLPHEVKGRKHGEDYMTFYNPETKEIVRKFYERDFELFDYAK